MATLDGIRRSNAERPEVPDDYGDVIARVTSSSPRVLAAWHAWSTRIEDAGVAAALPLPRLRYTAPFAAQGGDGPMQHLVELEQALPSPISLLARRDIGLARVDEARQRYEMTVLEVMTEVVEQLAEVRFLQQAIVSTQVNEQLALQLVGAADLLLAKDAGTLFDVSRARSQLAQLRVDRLRFEELLVATTGQLSALLDLGIDADFGPLAAWPLGPEPDSLEALCRLTLERQPALKAIDAEITASMARVTEARGRWWPELMIGVMWRLAGTDPGAPGMTDEVGLMVGLELPLWRTAESGSVAGAEAMLSEKAFEKKGMLRILLAEIQSEWLNGRNARRLLRLYDETLLPEARRAMSNATALQTAQSAGFTDALEARGNVHTFTLARERAYADAVKAEARLRRLVGDLPGVTR